MVTRPTDMGDDYNRDGGGGGEATGAADVSPPRARRATLDGWLWPLALGAAVFAIVHPYDLQVFETMSGLGNRLGGDVRREWFAWQQYGQGLAVFVAAVLIWLLDPARRRRLLDLGLAAAIAQAASTGGKMLVGRPRPRPEFMDPASFPGPWGLYPIQQDGHWVLVHAWDRAAGASADLWSMPSSHTLFAFTFSVFLSTVYPRGRWVFGVLAVLVGTGRVVFGAHWPTDAVIGAAVGYTIGAVVTRRGLGVRLLDRVWIRFIDRAAAPAWGRLVGPER